ncbi:hypothetical protein D3C84_711580 [compost metagenome]
MRANRTAALGSAYEFDFSTSSSTHSVSGTQAQKDIAEWLNAVALTLPEGTGKVEKTGALVTISVRWNDNRGRIKNGDGGGNGIETFDYRTEI